MTFINPYNFIPLPKEKGKKIEKEEPKYTGYIEYELLTKTPLFIANTTTDKAFSDDCMTIEESGETEEEKEENRKKIMNEHKRMDFFSYHALKEKEDACYPPVIPGSEIRGMLRSNYEILTNSCLSVLDEDAILSKRTAECFKAGLIKKTENGFELYEAVDHLWRTTGANNTTDELNWEPGFYNRKCYIQKDFPEGQKVYFTQIKRVDGKIRCKPLAQDVSKEWEKGKKEGYVIKGEDGPEMAPDKNGKSYQKHCCHIFSVRKKRDENVWVDSRIDSSKRPLNLQVLDRVLDEYKKNNDNAYKEYSEKYKKFKKEALDGAFFPVYYSIVPGINKIYLSPAVKTREIYSKQLKNIVKGLTPCKKKENLCPACSLFGTLLGKTSVASKVRFSDLNVIPPADGDNSKYYDRIVTLYPLSSPKTGNVEFYMKKPDERAAFWTYDYYVDERGNLSKVNQPEINGRKFFWHHPGKWELPKDVLATNQNITIRPVKREVTFEGRVYFEKITETELKQLIWLLNAGDTTKDVAKKEHGYKLGAAKPLGLGSVAVAVKEDGVKLRTVQCEQGVISYELESYREDMGQPFVDEKTVEKFNQITEFDFLRSKVDDQWKITYPMKDGQKSGTEGFEWFVENHKAIRKNKDGVYVLTRSPNLRTQMRYQDYLKPLQPQLERNKIKPNS